MRSGAGVVVGRAGSPSARLRAATALLGGATMSLAAVIVLAHPVHATQVDDALVADLADDGVAVEPGAPVDEGEVADAVRDVRDDGVLLAFAALASAVGEGGAEVIADDLAARLPAGTVVVVLATDEFGYRSLTHDPGELDRAADAAFPAFREGEAARGIRTFAQALDGGAVVEDDGRGISGSMILIVGLLLVGGIALFRGSRATRRVAQRRVEQARSEVRHQIDAMSDKILAISDRVTIGAPEAQEAYAQATTAFRQASEGFAAATTEAQLTQLNDSLDRARWQLDVTTALLDGTTPPAEPEEGATACFFDPDHGAGVQQATLRTPAGERTVGVCDYCAAKLDRGEAPEPRRIAVGGDAVPVSMAPREYGGRGMADLDVFSILFGRGGPVPYRWGGGYSRRRRHYGGFAGGGRRGGWGSGGFGGGIGGGTGRGGGGSRSFGGGGSRSFGRGGFGSRRF